MSLTLNIVASTVREISVNVENVLEFTEEEQTVTDLIDENIAGKEKLGNATAQEILQAATTTSVTFEAK